MKYLLVLVLLCSCDDTEVQEYSTHAVKKGPPGGSTCFLADGRGWKKAVPWGVDFTDSPFTDAALLSVIEQSIVTWESATRKDVFGSYDPIEPHIGVSFGLLGAGLIAQTFVTRQKQRPVIWHITLNVEVPWSLTGDPQSYDLLNILTHEMGHAAGLGHPDTSCVAETMHRFTALGETKKRDLHAGDIAGIQSLR